MRRCIRFLEFWCWCMYSEELDTDVTIPCSTSGRSARCSSSSTESEDPFTNVFQRTRSRKRTTDQSCFWSQMRDFGKRDTRFLVGTLTTAFPVHQLTHAFLTISVSENEFDSATVRRDTTLFTSWKTTHFRIRLLQWNSVKDTDPSMTRV